MTTTATAALTAALYARVSTEQQDADDKTSLSEQIGDMEAYCESKGVDHRRTIPGGREREHKKTP